VLPRALHGEVDTESEHFEELMEYCISAVQLDSSSGVPYHVFGKDNGAVLNAVPDLIRKLVKDRINALKGDIQHLSAEELVQQGFTDPIRVFVKNEPHSIEKANSGRWRLISSVSLVDQIVDRILNQHINTGEIARNAEIPSKPGMGFDESGVKCTIDYYKRLRKPANSDIKAHDFSVCERDYHTDTEYRLRSHTENVVDSNYAKICRNRDRCLMLSVFMLSDGQMYAQRVAGILKSGGYKTSSTTSRIRVANALRVGADLAMAMGDDCLEDFTENAVEKYLALGYRLKFYDVCGEVFDFCSHYYDPVKYTAWAQGIAKETMRLLHRNDINTLEEKSLAMMQYLDDLRGNPDLDHVLAILESVGWYGQ
jgi:hypothetical protein